MNKSSELKTIKHLHLHIKENVLQAHVFDTQKT